MSKTIKYVGKHRRGVYVAGDRFCGYGQSIEVDDDVADSLIAQGGFEAVKPKSTPKASEADATPETEA